MSKHKKIDSYFKRKPSDKDNEDDIASISLPQQNSSFGQVVQPDQQPSKVQKVSIGEHDINSLERDPGKRPQIWEYPVNQRDEIRRAYLNWGPYQCDVEDYPLNKDKNPRRFQSTWLKMFPSWLEYSIVNDAAYCLPCYLFSNKPSAQAGSDVFTRKGFRAWKKVNAGKNCAFLIHLGGSPHNNAIKACFDLLNQSGHIRNIFNVQSSDQIKQNRLRLRSSIDSIRWLTFQACAFRGHDETPQSKNRGNFLELIKLLASYNDELAKVVLENAPYNSKYTSHIIQKEIMHIMSSKVRRYIRDEIGDSKFCIVIDESCDESQREQMAIVLRFVDKNGYIQERFFDIVHVKDTTSITLKKAICGVLSQHNLDVSNIRGQGYDGASNMRGEWNGLQALFLKDCSHAYYTGPYEITTRWTMVMKFRLLPWKPALVFTGISVMGVNPENGKFCSHVDFWDSIQKNDYFSLEGLLEVIKQVRQYDPFIVVETNGDKLSGSTGFNDVAGYIFGKNSTTEKIPMTTPVFTEAIDTELSKVSIQIVLPSDKERESLPDPKQETVSLRKVEGGIAAVAKFSGKPADDIVREKEKTLRSNIIKDGLKPQIGCLFARYNDPGRTWSFIMVWYKTCLNAVN
ncbi:hypothetical protein TanjilG_28948 [Lupinus angustifolius]|uniref:TTF-type domain-containing protein n=1 Tax=Lupinus angustifolius TaxID=3871 RepID=A0A4P1QXP0_LUPAN|nr:hypothetical protein TanjilG_28948 [Lupinus angustifolius]